MKFAKGKERVWKEGLGRNNDGKISDFGGAIYYFAERWANAMEKRIENGEKLSDIAVEESVNVLREMEGYMLSDIQMMCAVSILSEVWKYGEELKYWSELFFKDVMPCD